MKVTVRLPAELDSHAMGEPSVATTDLLAGHLGHLSKDQEDKFAVFKRNIATASLYVPQSANGTPASHDDVTLMYVEGLTRLSSILNPWFEQAFPPCEEI